MEHARAYLFDAVTGTGRDEIDAMNARVAACYAWAERQDLQILDELIAWPGSGRPAAELLADLLALCRRDGAVLLVHSPAVLPTVPAQESGATGSPDGRVPVLSVTGPAGPSPGD